jgi:uncharacterized membrane protein
MVKAGVGCMMVVHKWRVLVGLFLGMVMALFLLPNEGSAVEFSITDVKIDAYLQDNGDVKVKETHTYSFDGDFNGITREIIPKEGTNISKLKAEENGKSLKVEKEDGLYKIYRKGSDETITVDLMYTIKDGVNVYADVAEFYWPFFDERNESSYENLLVTIHPPEATENPIAFGYDEAFQTERIESDGSVSFHLGEVPSEENGDIRVAFDAALFPSAAVTTNKPMKAEILQAEQELKDEAAAREKNKEKIGEVAGFIVLIFTLFLVVVMLGSCMKARMKKTSVKREERPAFFVPKQTMSLPATIFYTNGYQSAAEAMAAAFLDLVRQGFVKKIEDDLFKLSGMNHGIFEHERVLIDFLFGKVGKNGNFRFSDLAAYTKNKNNHETYRSFQTKWTQAVYQEIREKGLYEKKTRFRLMLGLSNIILLPFFILLPAYDLFGWFAAVLILFLTGLFFAIFYKPKSRIGLVVSYEWKMLREGLRSLSEAEWSGLPEDDRMRAYLYGIGTKDKSFSENKQLVEFFKAPEFERPGFDGPYYPAGMSTIFIYSNIASSSFQSAHTETQATISSSTSSSGGGGVGGGGGGSGAF